MTTRANRSALTDLVAAAGLALLLSMSPAAAETIYTGGEQGAYHSHFCPALANTLIRQGLRTSCATTNGSTDNLSRIANKPDAFGYSQFDVFALEAERFGGRDKFQVVRRDDVRECVFAVTKRADMTNYGEVAVFASQLKFYLPPENSGSTGTFRFLQQIDPEGLGLATAVRQMRSTEGAIRKALADPDGVAFFVQFADPRNPRFRMIEDLGGHIVPVIDRVILAQSVDGKPIYFAQETQVTNSRWLKAGRKVTTACTPLVLLTGSSKRIDDSATRSTHVRLVRQISAARAQDVLPNDGLFSRILKRTKQLSASSAERLKTLSQDARERAVPLLERAKQAGREAMERARDGANRMIEKARPDGAQ